MIYVDYRYFRKRDQKWVNGTSQFYTPSKAIRFIYSMESRGYVYLGFSCDDYEELEYMERRL